MIDQVIQAASEFAPNDNVRALVAAAGAAGTVGLAGYGLLRRTLRRRRRLSEKATKVLHLIDSLPRSKWDVQDDIFTNGNITVTAWRDQLSVVSPQFNRLTGRDAKAIIDKLDAAVVEADQARLADSMTVDKMTHAVNKYEEAPAEEPIQTYPPQIRRIFELDPPPQSDSPTAQILNAPPVEIEGTIQVGLTPEQTDGTADVLVRYGQASGKPTGVLCDAAFVYYYGNGRGSPNEAKVVEAPPTPPNYWKDKARQICELPPSDAVAEFLKLNSVDVVEVGNIIKKEYGPAVYDFMISEREKAAFVSVPVDPNTTVAEDTISGFKDFAEKLEAGEPIEATVVVKQGMASEEILELRTEIALRDEQVKALIVDRDFWEKDSKLGHAFLDTVTKERDEFRTLTDALKATEEDYKRALTEYDEELQKERRLVVEERRKNTELTAQVKQHKEGEEKVIVLLSKRGTELDLANFELKAVTKKLEEQVKATDKANDELASALKQLVGTQLLFTTANSQLTHANALNAQLTKQRDAADVRVKELVAECDTLSEQKRAAEQTLGVANRNYEALQEEFKKLDLRAIDEMTLRKQLASECEGLKAKIVDLTSERNAARGAAMLAELNVNKSSVTHNAQELCLTATGKTDIKVPSILRMDDLTFTGKFMGQDVVVERKDTSLFLLPKQQTV